MNLDGTFLIQDFDHAESFQIDYNGDFTVGGNIITFIIKNKVFDGEEHQASERIKATLLADLKTIEFHEGVEVKLLTK